MNNTRIPMPILSAMHPGNPCGVRFAEGDGGESGAGQESGEGAQGDQQEQQAPSFSQADVDRIVSERVQRERAKFSDYDDLKAKAGEARTAEERIASLELEVQSSKHAAMKSRVQAAHGISDEDAALFLTGGDEETLTNQAKRLAARDSERQHNGNHVPGEGKTPQSTVSSDRQAVKQLFGSD